MAGSADLVFVHLSDIHFRRNVAGSAHDPDREVRDALTADLRTMASRWPKVDGIIITGDIAFSGHASEYKFADAWIRGIAGHLKCKIADVMVIPGNHDVDRAKLRKFGGRIARLQNKIRHGRRSAVCVERL